MATRRGVALVLTLIAIAIVVSAAGMLAAYLLVTREPSVERGSTLLLRVRGQLAEEEPSGVISQFLEAPTTVRSLVDALRKARVDRRVTAVVVTPSSLAALWGKVQEVRDAVLEFRRSGKPIVAYLEYGGQQEYYLATACDRVFLMPTSPLEVTGLASYDLFFRGTLDKIGTYPDLLHIGEYKTASNTFTEKTYTPAHREMSESLNGDLYDQLVRAIAQGRKKSEADVRQLLDRGPFLPEEAMRAGLVDDLAYEDQLDDKAKLGGRLKRLDFDDYKRVSPGSLGLNVGPRIAVIHASGLISTGESDYDSTQGTVMGSDTIVKYIRTARADDSVKAIVLRIDSPGGSAIGSDVIWREVLLTRNQKPVVASLSDVAASGGYYIAMPAQAIVAQPGTLTGSIGVVLGKFATGGTYNKLGMTIESVKRGRFADMHTPTRPYLPEERVKLEELMQATYDDFVEKAAAGRHTTPERIDAVAQGRVWTGRQARQAGLVDELGGLDRALAIAKQRARIAADAEVELVIYPPKKSLFDVLSEPLRGRREYDRIAAALGLPERRALGTLAATVRLFGRGEPLALAPFFLR